MTRDILPTVKVLAADFVTGGGPDGPRPGLLRDDLPQVAFIGRSNVGKSSLLNALMRQKLARTSAAAGKTRQANIFRVTVEDAPGRPGRFSLYLVDLPGYGYARGGDASADEIARVVEAYLTASRIGTPGDEDTPRKARAMVLLVDARHPSLSSDLDAYRWFVERGATPTVIATKIDKLSRSDRTKHLRTLARHYGRPVPGVSTLRGEGIDDVWRTLAALTRDRPD